MKVFKCKKNGKVTNQWTIESVDSQGRTGINYREDSFGPEGTFEIIEEEDNSERKDKLKRLKELRDAVKAETFADAFEDFILKEVPPYTQKQVRDYKQALKNVLDPYKNWKDDPEAAARLDALVVEDFVWPVIQ
jgi:hypothetical protein